MRLRLSVLLLVVATLAIAPVAKPVDDPDFRTLMLHLSLIANTNTRPLLATAEAAEAAFVRGNFCAADGALGALENQLNARFVDNPDYVDDPNIRNAMADIAAIRNLYPPGPCKGLGGTAPPCGD